MTLTALAYAPPPASAAAFCASKISASTYYQHDFSYGGSVVATICSPGYNAAGNAYLYARGSYANVKKTMSLSVQKVGGSTVSVSGSYYSYAYVYAPSGAHNYHAVMYNGSGTRIVNGNSSDYE